MEKGTKIFANSSFLIFRTANRNGKALQIPKVQLTRQDTGVREVKVAFQLPGNEHFMIISMSEKRIDRPLRPEKERSKHQHLRILLPPQLQAANKCAFRANQR